MPALVAALLNALPLALTTVAQVDAFIAKLNDRRRTLEDAEKTRRAARDRLRGDGGQ